MSTMTENTTASDFGVTSSVEVQSGGGWVLRNADSKHKCTLPSDAALEKEPAGSIWLCDSCGQNWRVSTGRGKNEGTKTLRRVSAEMVAKKLAKKAAKKND